ncbi:hypothetical protein ACQKMI_19310 [Lysinibacillus sp. NPDC097214]|uniref:hypothetical protein n=1 Tax=Lysinibacillus sp. NPDC097214 TaxID=3390584 RepID=UPI003D03B820
MSEIELEKRLRIGTIQSGLRRAYNRLESDINRTKNDEQFNQKVFDVNASICELLFWVNANDEWQCKNNETSYLRKKQPKKDGAGELYGLKHAYNASKHNMSYVNLFSFEGTNDFIKGSNLKIKDPSTPAIWVNCPDDEEHINQVLNYRKYLKGKNVLTTFNKAITFLNKMNNQVIFR